MLYLAFMTVLLVTSQPMEMEVGRTVEEYLSQLDLAPTDYAIVVSDQVPEGAAVLHWVEAGQDKAVFFFHRGLFLQLSRRERRVLIAHEVGHLASECQRAGTRISREICADRISLRLVPRDDVAGMLARSIVLFPYTPAQEEFIYRFGVIQENRPASRESALQTTPETSFSPQHLDWLTCD